MKKINEKLKVVMWVSIGMALVASVVFCVMSIIMYNKAQNKGSFDNLSFSSYESSDEAFSYINNYKFLNCYGDVRPADIDSVIPILAAWFPNTFPQFLEDKGVIVLTEDFPGMVQKYFGYNPDDYGKSVRGFFTVHCDKCNRPVICINLSYHRDPDPKSPTFRMSLPDETPIHEMAHYIDYKNGYTSTDEFKEYFSKYSEGYEPFSNVIEGYQNKDENEFFAILFTDILKSPYPLSIPDDLLEYMLNVIKDNS